MLAAGRGWHHYGVGIHFGDAEMAAEVKEIQRAQQAGYLDDVHVALRADEDGNIVDFSSVEVKPHVRNRFCGLRAGSWGLVGVDEMLPACGVIGGYERAHGFRGVKGRPRIVVGIDGNAVKRGGGLPGVAVVDEAAGVVEHGAIKSNGNVSSRLIGELVEGL